MRSAKLSDTWRFEKGIKAFIEIAFEAVCDPSLQCDCFGLLMRQQHIPKGVSRHVHQGGAFVR